jgi:AraC-like DNA-binding protein
MNRFSEERIHTVTDANVNFYNTPFVHPVRTMEEHDFIYLLRGQWVMGQNQETYRLEEDSLLILFAGNTHYGVSPCEAGTKTMYFHVSREKGDRFGGEEGLPTHLLTAGNPRVRQLFADVVHYKLSGEQRKADLSFEMLLCELSSQKMCLKETEPAERIRSIIHGSPETFFGNRELADMLNVSVKTAETRFKAAFGMTIHQYTLDFKIKEAKAYFDRFPHISVKEVAYNLGFCDEYHFSKQFSRQTGISPGRYKRKRDGF